jgi:hypothetical protein
MTLDELRAFAHRLDLVNALNLDGEVRRRCGCRAEC